MSTVIDEKGHEPGESRLREADLEAARASVTPSLDELEIESIREAGIRDDVSRISAQISLGPDTPVEQWSSFTEVPDEFYDRITPGRKLIIVAVLSYCSFLAPISSTTVLAATPEVAQEFNSTGSVVDVSNALYMLFMGISPLLWGPLSQVYGRRFVSVGHLSVFSAVLIPLFPPR